MGHNAEHVIAKLGGLDGNAVETRILECQRGSVSQRCGETNIGISIDTRRCRRDEHQNTESLVLKISSSAVEQLAKEAPEIATPFLLAIGKTLTARIRADNKRYGDSVKFARAAE